MWFRTCSRFRDLPTNLTIESVHRGEDALAQPAFDGLRRPIALLLEPFMLLVHRLVQHIFPESFARHRPDSDPESRELPARQRALDALDPAMSAARAARPHSQLAHRQVDVVADHEHRLRLELVS